MPFIAKCKIIIQIDTLRHNYKDAEAAIRMIQNDLQEKASALSSVNGGKVIDAKLESEIRELK